jgi:hypothetical protein
MQIVQKLGKYQHRCHSILEWFPLSYDIQRAHCIVSRLMIASQKPQDLMFRRLYLWSQSVRVRIVSTAAPLSGWQKVWWWIYGSVGSVDNPTFNKTWATWETWETFEGFEGMLLGNEHHIWGHSLATKKHRFYSKKFSNCLLCIRRDSVSCGCLCGAVEASVSKHNEDKRLEELTAWWMMRIYKRSKGAISINNGDVMYWDFFSYNLRRIVAIRLLVDRVIISTARRHHHHHAVNFKLAAGLAARMSILLLPLWMVRWSFVPLPRATLSSSPLLLTPLVAWALLPILWSSASSCSHSPLHYAWRTGTEWRRCDFRTNLILW